MDAILNSIGNGEWQEENEQVRWSPCKSDAYEKTKLKLAAFTPAGRFKRVNNAGLIENSGCFSVDLDNLKPRDCLKTIASAVLDPYCVAAFHSPHRTRGEALVSGSANDLCRTYFGLFQSGRPRAPYL